MAFCQDGDVVRVTCKMSHYGGADTVQNRYFVKLQMNSPLQDSQCHDAIADHFDTAYGEIAPGVTDGVTFDSIETWNITQDRPMVEDGWPTLTVGLDGGQPCPAQSAPVILFNTAAPRSQGRKFLPFPSEGHQSAAGILDGTYLGYMADFGAALLQAIVLADGYGLTGNWSKKYSRFAPWISAVVKSVLRTQRRRVHGVGS